jgi:hypothetical protein
MISKGKPRKKIAIIAIIVLAPGVTFLAWQSLKPKRLPEGFATGNGRSEAVEIDVATKTPRRLSLPGLGMPVTFPCSSFPWRLIPAVVRRP